MLVASGTPVTSGEIVELVVVSTRNVQRKAQVRVMRSTRILSLRRIRRRKQQAKSIGSDLSFGFEAGRRAGAE